LKSIYTDEFKKDIMKEFRAEQTKAFKVWLEAKEQEKSLFQGDAVEDKPKPISKVEVPPEEQHQIEGVKLKASTIENKPRKLKKALAMNDEATRIYKQDNLNYDYYYVVDKPSSTLYRVDINGSPRKIGSVGIGKNRGDRDVSKGRTSGKNSLQTQSGWVRINRETPYAKRSRDYGDEFNGFEAMVGDKWKEIPTGIHGTMNETSGRVSHGCTRLDDCIEKETREGLKKGVLVYYTSDA